MKSLSLIASCIVIVLFVVPGSSPCSAATVMLDFENLFGTYLFSGGGQNIGTFYPGLAFGPNVTGLSATRFGGYDNIAYPAHSGDVVVWSPSDNNINLTFSSLQNSVGFWYTSLDPLTLTAFGSTHSVLGSILGNGNTDGTSGTSSFLSISSAGTASVIISSSAGQYVIDDLQFSSLATAIPETSSAWLILTGLGIGLILLRRCR